MSYPDTRAGPTDLRCRKSEITGCEKRVTSGRVDPFQVQGSTPYGLTRRVALLRWRWVLRTFVPRAPPIPLLHQFQIKRTQAGS